MLHNLPDVGRIFRNQRHHAIAERLARFVPRAFVERVGRILEKDPHDVLAGRRGDGSYIVGTVSSSSGRSDSRPQLASSQARSTYSTLGAADPARRGTR